MSNYCKFYNLYLSSCENPELKDAAEGETVICKWGDKCEMCPRFKTALAKQTLPTEVGEINVPKCKYREINPLNDTYICTKVLTNISLPGAKYATCTWHDPWSCPAAEFEEDIPENDHVNHPNHYCQGGIECIKAIEASMPPEGFQDYCKGNVLKYIWRWRDKAGVEDLKKARVYLNWLIESAEKGDTNV